jgi:hypothetical protein
MAKDVGLPAGFVLDDGAAAPEGLPEGFSLDSEPAPANPISADASPAQVIRNAAMGRIKREDADAYLKSIALDPALIDNFGKDASTGDTILGMAQKPAQGLTMGFADEALGSVLPAPVIENMRRQSVVAAINHPIASTGLEVGGGVVGAAALARMFPSIAGGIANVAAKGPLQSLAANGGVGAISGGVYGFGSGEGGGKARLENAGDMGLFGGLGGVAGAAVARVAAPLTEKAMRLFGGGVKAPAAIAGPVAATGETIARSPLGVLPESRKGALVPLTKGQATQESAAQSLENMARSGALDDASQSAMLKADSVQQDAIKGAMQKVAGGEMSEDGLVAAGKAVKGAYGSIKAGVSKAYDDAAAIRGVFIDKKPIADSFAPRVKDVMYKQGFDAENLTPETKKLLAQVEGGAMTDNKVSAINLEKMEFWRRKISNRAEQMKGDPEGVMLGRVRQAYDDFMGKLPAGALKSGDESALKAIDDARSLRRRQGVLFERDKVVSNIVKNDELTNEELANVVLTGSVRSKNVNDGSGRSIRAMKRAVGDNAPELVDNLRRGTFARILNKATTNNQRAGSDVPFISPSKLLSELDGLARNKTFMNEVFEPGHRQTIDALRGDLRKIVSEQPGSKNYSNTAYTLLNYMRRMPLGLSSMAGIAQIGLKPIAEKGARDELNRSLANVIGEVQSELVGKAKLYGAATGGGIAGKQGASAQENGRD